MRKHRFMYKMCELKVSIFYAILCTFFHFTSFPKPLISSSHIYPFHIFPKWLKWLLYKITYLTKLICVPPSIIGKKENQLDCILCGLHSSFPLSSKPSTSSVAWAHWSWEQWIDLVSLLPLSSSFVSKLYKCIHNNSTVKCKSTCLTAKPFHSHRFADYLWPSPWVCLPHFTGSGTRRSP